MQQIYLYSAKSCFECLKGLVKNGVSVSTVGLSDADDTLMTMIADKTGGVYVKAGRCFDTGSSYESGSSIS